MRWLLLVVVAAAACQGKSKPKESPSGEPTWLKFPAELYALTHDRSISDEEALRRGLDFDEETKDGEVRKDAAGGLEVHLRFEPFRWKGPGERVSVDSVRRDAINYRLDDLDDFMRHFMKDRPPAAVVIHTMFGDREILRLRTDAKKFAARQAKLGRESWSYQSIAEVAQDFTVELDELGTLEVKELP